MKMVMYEKKILLKNEFIKKNVLYASDFSLSLIGTVVLKKDVLIFFFSNIPKARIP